MEKASIFVPSIEVFDDIVKSPSDHKCYRGLVLPNGLKVLIASEPTSQKCAVSVSVAVGMQSK
jgi:insulysin